MAPTRRRCPRRRRPSKPPMRPLRRQGDRAGPHDRRGHSGAAGVRDRHRRLPPVPSHGQRVATGSSSEVRRVARLEARRAGVRRRDASAAGVGALRRAGQHARHDGHSAESRPDRKLRADDRARARRPGFAVDTWVRFWRMFADIVLDLDRGARGRRETPQSERSRRHREPSRRSSRRVLRACRRAGERRRRRSAGQLSRHCGCLPVLGQPAGQGLPTAPRHPRRPRHRSHGAGHGVRQRRRSGSGVAFTRNPNTGRASCTANTSPAGRARTWSPARTVPSSSPTQRMERVPLAAEQDRRPRGALSRRGRHRVHRRGRTPLSAAGAARETHGGRPVRIAVDMVARA